VRYNILNYHPAAAAAAGGGGGGGAGGGAGGGGSFATLGAWSFVSSDAGWADSFVASPSAPPISWATQDGASRPPAHATGDGFVRIGLACGNASGVARDVAEHELCDRWRHGITLLNNKSDGFFDELLPGVTIVHQAATAGCAKNLVRTAFDEINSNLPRVSAYLGPSCSDDVRQVAEASWRSSSGVNAVNHHLAFTHTHNAHTSQCVCSQHSMNATDRCCALCLCVCVCVCVCVCAAGDHLTRLNGDASERFKHVPEAHTSDAKREMDRRRPRRVMHAPRVDARCGRV